MGTSKENFEQFRERRDLVGANNLANWAALGVLWPIVGIILAIIARNKVNYVVETEENWQEISKVRAKANAWIAISLFFFFFWSFMWLLFVGVE
jgi:hypothetical protein